MCDDGDDAIVPQEDSVCASLAVCLDSNRGYGLDSNRGYAICVGGSLLCLYVDIRRECRSSSSKQSRFGYINAALGPLFSSALSTPAFDDSMGIASAVICITIPRSTAVTRMSP